MLDVLINLLTPIFVSMGASAADVANYVRAAGGYVYAILGILAAVVVVMVAAQFVVKKGARHVVRWTGALAGVLAIVLVVNLVCFGPMYAMVSGVLTPPRRRSPTTWWPTPWPWCRRPARRAWCC